MVKVIPYEAGHLELIEAQDHQSDIKDVILNNPHFAQEWVYPDLTYSLLDDDGEIIFCGGILPLHVGVADTWSVLSIHFPKYALTITKKVIDFLDRVQIKDGFYRLQMTTATGFKPAERWARILGFNRPHVMRKYGTKGNDCILWERIR